MTEHSALPAPQIHLPKGLTRMSGRDPREPDRASTPLELLFDLTLVVAFGVAGNETAHLISEGAIAQGVLGFMFALFALTWAWINYSWFASAYDTDDWFMRLATMVIMLGVVILALGLPTMFEGMHHWHLDNKVMVGGYVVMRLGMVALWLRAWREDPVTGRTAFWYAVVIGVAQIGWCLTAFAHLPNAVLVPLFAGLLVLETGGVQFVERRLKMTPWHPHHIAERYSLLTIITLGEVIVGTVSSLQSVVATQGWSLQAAAVGFAGVTMTFGLWWNYFAIPHGEALEVRRENICFIWGYGHMPFFWSIAGVGMGLHVAASFVAGEGTLGEVGAVSAVAIPLVIYVLCLYGLAHLIMPGRDPLHWWLLVATFTAVVAALACAAAGMPIGIPLLILTLAPWVTVVGYERRGGKQYTERVVEHIRATYGTAA